MDQNQNNNAAPAQNPFGPNVSKEKQPTIVAMAVAFFLLFSAALALWYYLLANDGRMPRLTAPQSSGEIAPESIPVGADDAVEAALSAQSDSDEMADITADLEATDLGALDNIDQI